MERATDACRLCPKRSFVEQNRNDADGATHGANRNDADGATLDSSSSSSSSSIPLHKHTRRVLGRHHDLLPVGVCRLNHTHRHPLLQLGFS
jgi:hypothetical protein